MLVLTIVTIIFVSQPQRPRHERTVANSTSFMGGDLCHHGSQLRPSPDLHIPSHVQIHDGPVRRHGGGGGCLGAAFEQLNIKRGRRRDQPFFDPVLAVNVSEAIGKPCWSC